MPLYLDPSLNAKSLCEVCIKAKQTRSSFKSISEEKKARRVLETVSSDVAGPIVPATHDGMNYYVTFTDHYTHFSQIYLMKRKDEVYDLFREYVALVTSKFETQISNLRCDNGGEYCSQQFKKFCKEKGIQIQYTVPRNPEQNGVSERFNRTVLNMARSMIFDAGMEKSFWGEAVRCATYILNRLPTSAIKPGSTPADLWYNREVSLENIRVFGAKAYAHVPATLRSKLDVRSNQMVMIGYVSNGYRLWNPVNKKVITARSIIFDKEKKNGSVGIPIAVIEEDAEEKVDEIQSAESEDE
uniref:Integrase catalytic domain-containing protein n=1 Tax=Photinus pyralis TaxID=7054 RepID=A0A1Y1KVS3_PHOPY